MRGITRALMAVSIIVSACGSAGPEIIVPQGVSTKRTADQVGRMMLFEITQNERALGRSLAEPRIIRIQLLRPGEMYQHRRLDGSNPDGVASGPDNGPGWMVEAVGTFISDGWRQPKTWGTHGFRMWADDGSETFGFFACGGEAPPDPSITEGTCP